MISGLVGCELYTVENDLFYRGIIQEIKRDGEVVEFVVDDGSNHFLFAEVHLVEGNRYFLGTPPRYAIVVDPEVG